MTREEITVSIYKSQISNLAHQYVLEYQSRNPEPSPSDAAEFLSERQEFYKKDVATLGMKIIEANLREGDNPQVIFDLNKHAISLLYVKITNLLYPGSVGNDKFM